MDVSDVIGAAFLPTDGQASPSDLCQAWPRAQMEGAKIIEGCRVTGFNMRDGRVAGVEMGNIERESRSTVAASGRECGCLAKVSVPVQPMQHQYLVTEPIEGVTADPPSCATRIDFAISRRSGLWVATSWSRCHGRRRTASRATFIFNCSTATGISSRACF